MIMGAEGCFIIFMVKSFIDMSWGSDERILFPRKITSYTCGLCALPKKYSLELEQSVGLEEGWILNQSFIVTALVILDAYPWKLMIL